MSEAQHSRVVHEAQIAFQQGDFHRAAERFTTYVGMHPEPTSLELVAALQSLGVCHKKLGQLDSAFECYGRALELSRAIQRADGTVESPAKAEEASALSNMGVVLKEQGRILSERKQGVASLAKYKLAEQHFDEALEIDLLLEDHAAVASDLLNLGNLQLRDLAAGSSAKAKASFEECLRYSVQVGRIDLIGAAVCGIGNVHRALGEYSKAAAKYREALSKLTKSSEYHTQWLVDLTTKNLREVELLAKGAQ
jgi:tetratricopeptide (TPR) repeat protein